MCSRANFRGDVSCGGIAPSLHRPASLHSFRHARTIYVYTYISIYSLHVYRFASQARRELLVGPEIVEIYAPTSRVWHRRARAIFPLFLSHPCSYCGVVVFDKATAVLHTCQGKAVSWDIHKSERRPFLVWIHIRFVKNIAPAYRTRRCLL